MKFEELNRESARTLFQSIKSNGIPSDYFDDLSPEYKKIRDDILRFAKPKVEKTYEFDLMFSIKLHDYFSTKNFEEFNEAVASNYDFWRYICLKVVPDIIIQRHGYVDSYFYDKNVRMYIPTMWWYIEMSDQGDYDTTYNVLKRFSTDYILNFVERPGRDGMYIDVVRYIFRYLNQLPMSTINEKKGKKTLIRRILLQHTARNVNYNLVVEGKTELYVKGLFYACGVEVQ